MDTKWSERDYSFDYLYWRNAERTLAFYLHEHEDILSKDEYVWFAERGFVKLCDDYNSNFKSSWQVVILTDPEIQNKLLKLGETAKAKHLDRFEKIRKPYVDAMLQTVPSHLRKVKEFELHFLLHDDPRFLLHCIHSFKDSERLCLRSSPMHKR